MNFRNKQGGTTLIEILVSILLLSIGLLGLVGLQGRSSQTTVDAENRGYAALAANELITAMWAKHDPTSANSSIGATCSTGPIWTAWQSVTSRALPSGTCSVSAPGTNGAVTITINWTAPGQQSSTQTVTNQYITTVSIP